MRCAVKKPEKGILLENGNGVKNKGNIIEIKTPPRVRLNKISELNKENIVSLFLKYFTIIFALILYSVIKFYI